MMELHYALRPDLCLRVAAKEEPLLFRSMLGPPGEASSPDIVLTLGALADGDASNSGRYKGIGWRLRSEATETGGREIAFSAEAFAPYLALHIALLPAIRVALFAAEEFVVPGAAFLYEGGAVLLLGGTGSGKSGALLQASSEGRKAIGDEYVSVDAFGNVGGILRGCALRRAAVMRVRGLYDRLSSGQKRLLLAMQAAAMLTRGRLNPLVHVGWHDLGIEQHRSPTPLRATVWVNPMETAVRPLAAEDVAEAGLAHIEAHDRAYGIAASSAAGGSDSILRLASALGSAPCFTAPPSMVRQAYTNAGREAAAR